MHRCRLVPFAVVLTTLGLAGSAHAGALSQPNGEPNTLRFSGDARADDLTVTYSITGTSVVLSDPAAVISLPSSVADALDCAHTDKTAVVCRSIATLQTFHADLGAGADRVRVTGGERSPFPIGERLDGGDGDDTLTGGRGVTIFQQEPGADQMTGGGGRDRVFYSSGAGVTVSEDGIANDGSPGELDNVGADIELVGGTEGSDQLTASPGGTELRGGNGNDRLTGGNGPDVLDPGFGRDIITGGAGEDQVAYCCGSFTVSLDGLANDGLTGDQSDSIASDVEDIHTEGPGTSTLTGSGGANRFTVGPGNRAAVAGLGGDDLLTAGADAQSFSGGAGFDTITYADRSVQFHSAPVTVTIDDVANDGDAGENDNVQTDVERVIGSPGDDGLTGGGGADTLEGGDGNDSIDGGAGADRLLGGAGDDVIRAREAVAPPATDGVECGAGDDIVTLDLQDPIPPDCENVAQAAVDQGPGLQISRRALRPDRRGRVALRLRCPRAERAGCRGRLTLSRPRPHARDLARRRYRLAPGRRSTMRLRLRPRARRTARLRATARETDPHGRPKLTFVTLRLRHRAR